MSNEWFDVAYINHNEAILHGQVAPNGYGSEREIRQVLTDEQIAAVVDLNEAHDAAMNKLLRSFVP